MRKFSGSEHAVSSVIGVVILVGLTVVMVAVIALSVASVSGSMSPEIAPAANIIASNIIGGLPPSVSFDENVITLKHKGGDKLDIAGTKIILYGIGRSYRNFFGGGYVPSPPDTGNVQVFYMNLTSNGKIPAYNTTNYQVLIDGYWSTGESLILSGEDSMNSDDTRSSVHVIVNGDGETSNNYGFRSGGKVYVTVVDSITGQIISSSFATVQQS